MNTILDTALEKKSIDEEEYCKAVKYAKDQIGYLLYAGRPDIANLYYSDLTTLKSRYPEYQL